MKKEHGIANTSLSHPQLHNLSLMINISWTQGHNDHLLELLCLGSRPWQLCFRWGVQVLKEEALVPCFKNALLQQL
jgi:hypothetical protein